ncbi:reverse transcriptase [Senna tora]|uniref:Reverse transcriptase n=1 Tax=Senna tora TaxID=362788 RepID=A0A834W8A0_9FABA|nr:reverse transcriptase [Senna tora]
MRFTAWNCRCFGCTTTIQRLKQLLRQYKPSFVYLLETKRSLSFVSNILRNLSYTCFVGTDLIGRSGGTFYCLAKGSMLQHFGDILWNWFIDKSKFINKPWIAIGDFNQIRYHHNKISKSNRVDGAGVFNQMIQICDFTDLNPTGTWCTWTNGRGSDDEVWARLDRTLCSDDWLQSYPCTTFSSLPVAASAHSPLIVDSCGVKPFCKRPFRFENLWLMFDKCNVVVNQSWETDVNSSPSVILHEKFNFLRGNLRIWNSHETSLVNGDRCTAYFHSLVKERRVQNQINAIKDDNDQWIDDYKIVEQMGIQYFEDIFTEESNLQVHEILQKLERYDISSLHQSHLDVLNKPFSIDECHEALNQMKLDSALRPDGFNVKFYRTFWDTIKADVEALLASFFDNGTFTDHFNRSFITLIPKTNAPQSFKDFRHISLANVSYKLITKVMYSRLKKEEEVKLWKGLKLGRSSTALTHLIVYDSTTTNIITNTPFSVIGVRDRLVWKCCSNDGNYSVKDDYKLVLKRNVSCRADAAHPHLPNNSHWKHIWSKILKLMLPYRIIMFLWRVLNNNLPSFSVLIYHHMQLQDVCLACHQENESLLHVFLQCSFAKASWFGTHLGYHFHTNHGANMMDWFSNWVLQLDQHTYSIINFIFVVLQVIWRCCNLRVMEGKQVHPTQAIQMIYAMSTSYNTAFRLHSLQKKPVSSHFGGSKKSKLKIVHSIPTIGISIISIVRKMKGGWNRRKNRKIFILVQEGRDIIINASYNLREQESLDATHLRVIKTALLAAMNHSTYKELCNIVTFQKHVAAIIVDTYKKHRSLNVLGLDVNNLLSAFTRFNIPVIRSPQVSNLIVRNSGRSLLNLGWTCL